jgi:hypothetical protein
MFINDYHEFRCANDVHIEEWQLYWSPNYVCITMGFLAIGGVVVNLNNSVTSGSGSVNGSGAIKSGGTKPSTSAWVHCLHSTQLWNSFMSCNGITMGLKLKCCETYRISNVSFMRTYEMPLHGCIG